MIKDTLEIFRKTFAAWSGHDAPRLAAALAFYTILSIAPLAILIIALVSLAFGQSAAQADLLGQVRSFIGDDGAAAVQTMIQHGQRPASGVFASIAGVITLVFGASGVFGELRSALNTIWNVSPQAGGGIAYMIRERLFSFGMVLASGFLLLVSFVMSATLAAVGKLVGGILPISELASFVAITGVFALIFRFVPETKIAWRALLPGAAATAFLFNVGKFLIGMYLAKAGVGSEYGAAGSLIVIIVWIYYSALIFFFGAEFTYVMAQR